MVEHIQFTAAPSGSGKTYVRCAVFLATEFLPFGKGVVYTNYPIDIEQMVADVIEHHPKMVYKDLVERIHIIPDAELRSWSHAQKWQMPMRKAGDTEPIELPDGPWKYFKDRLQPGDLVAIDEVHKFVSLTASKDYQQHWKDFLGDFRHRKATFEALSQYETKVAPLIRNEATLRRYLFNSENRCDPFLRIKMSDWYNLRASLFTGVYVAVVFETEDVAYKGKWVENVSRKLEFKSRFYKLYNSYNKPDSTVDPEDVVEHKSDGSEVHYFEGKTKSHMVWWFLRRNSWNISWRIAVFIIAVWILFGGGIALFMKSFSDHLSTAATSHSASSSNATPNAASPVPASSVQVTVGPPASAKVLEENAKLKEEIELLRKVIEQRSDLVLISGDTVIFRNGGEYSKGDVILEGPEKTHYIKEINHVKRYIVFDDGHKQYLSR